jgi:hypothetical protein
VGGRAEAADGGGGGDGWEVTDGAPKDGPLRSDDWPPIDKRAAYST